MILDFPQGYNTPVGEGGAALSGGQKCRAALAELLLEEADLLLLDEPTNHLDIEATRFLEKFLAGYHGAAIVVSHDRYLLQGTADRILEIRPEGHLLTEGRWSDHVKRRREMRATPRETGAAARPRAERVEAKPGHLRNPYKFARLEEETMEREARRDEILRLMEREDVYLDSERLKGLKEELPGVEADLLRLNEEWEQWTEDS